MEADWITRLNRDSRLAFGMRFHKVEIMDLENFTLQGASQSLMEIHSEYRTLLSREWGLLVGAGQRDHLFYRAVSTSAIKIDKIPALYGQFELSYEFSPGPFMRGALRGGLSIHAPVSFDAYHSKTGTGYSGAFRWTQDFNSLSFFAEPFYRKDVIPLEGLDYTETELGMGFGVLFPLK
ncbi:MAG: hypothetical protein EBX52_01335 [Proteobacteria bacterium]|nr:hypothetical protein [Pseudomonadota bacterium]